MKDINKDIQQWLSEGGRAFANVRLQDKYMMNAAAANTAVENYIKENPSAKIAKTKPVPNRLSTGLTGWPLIIWWAVLGGGLFYAGQWIWESVTTPRPPATADYSALKSNAYWQAKEAILLQLKSPASADFPDLTSNDHVEMTTPSTFSIVSYVDAQNSYGAEVRRPWYATIRYTGGDPLEDASWIVVDAKIAE